TLMRVTRLKEEVLKEAVNLIQSLDPRPGQSIQTGEPEYVIPDGVFLINSCSQLVSSTDFSSMSKSLHLRVSVPSPEVTAPFCLVP
ncbi:hypothetical protein ONN26_24785, partial [Salmonella enterica subsp. enterica serovar Muenster]|nr:hypothetical protein [Salmonella enterica subsp. enterica serovar Muenster]